MMCWKQLAQNGIFLPFKPGLVGGHCIGVDPYYLAQKAQEMGIILKLFSWTTFK